MTRKEFSVFAKAMRTYYPNEKILPTGESMELWYDMLKDVDYDLACASLKKHVATSKYAPSISEIRGGAADIAVPVDMNEQEAWNLVMNAIRNSAYNANEEFAKLPPLVQKAVGSPSQLREWGLDENLNREVAKSNFMKVYRTEVSRQRQYAVLPSSVRAYIDSTAAALKQKKLDGGHEGTEPESEIAENARISSENAF